MSRPPTQRLKVIEYFARVGVANLPTHAQICRELGVSRNTIKAAIDDLLSSKVEKDVLAMVLEGGITEVTVRTEDRNKTVTAKYKAEDTSQKDFQFNAHDNPQVEVE